MLRVEGPLAICQLLETTLLTLINFPSLVATNASRMRTAVGDQATLLEFGLRRAQGPDGGVSASKYAYIGGFDGTSNVLAGKLFGMNVRGTMAHSYIMCYANLQELQSTTIPSPSDPAVRVEFLSLVLAKRAILGFEAANEGELAAFISYVQALPRNFLALLDTYDTLTSGVKNFISVAWALYEVGYKPLGIRLDSGDLGYLSLKVREAFLEVDAKIGISIFEKLNIAVSNDINEEVLLSLQRDGHSINTFAVGTHLVTCQKQPALGCVYKLVEINGKPRIKLSQEIEKLAIPCSKMLYRLYGVDGRPLVDVLQTKDEPPPVAGEKILVRHAFMANKRAFVTPARVVSLLQPAFDGSLISSTGSGIVGRVPVSLLDVRSKCIAEIKNMRPDHVRLLNPTPYKVSVSTHLYDYMHALWMDEAPISHLS